MNVLGELFANSAGYGKCVALGGMHDGGADAYFEVDGRNDFFVQISKEASTTTKIKKTIDRIREDGREIKKLTYITSKVVPKSDKIRESIFIDRSVLVEIRDRIYVAQSTNDFPSAVQAAKDYLLPSLDYLKELHNSEIAPRGVLNNHRELAVFLTQEIERRRDDSSLPESVCDSLILWALEGTDPDSEKFLDKAGILKIIEDALPTASSMIRSRIDHRLSVLSDKGAPTGRLINFHKKENAYCLPYETRRNIETENVEDHELKAKASNSFAKRAMVECEDIQSDKVDEVVETCHSALHSMFEKQGLEMACFAAGHDLDKSFSKVISECVHESIDADDHSPIRTSEISMKVLRGVFYQSHTDERQYLARLSRTYTMLFALQAEPKIAEYFDKMSRKLILYVGSDIIIRALSEYFLDEEDQATTNLLKLLHAAGAKLILTERTLQEVWFHMMSDLRDFEANYHDAEKWFDGASAKDFPRILMRSYLYAKHDPVKSDRDKPRSFADYLNLFLDISDLRNNREPDSLESFLTFRFQLQFESSADMQQGIPENEIEGLAEKILEKKGQGRVGSKKLLAVNDALQVLRIYERRRQENDNSPSNPFGYSIWWLTQESAVVRATSDVVKRNRGARFLMRPEFLLTYVAYAPRLREIRANFKSFFPSNLGVRLSYRAKKDVFDRTVAEAVQQAHTDEARAQHTIRKMTNELKGAKYAEVDMDPIR